MNVKRYWISPNGIACEDNEGMFVRYEDHAALEARYLELAAESAEVKELIEQHANSVAVCPNCSHEEPSETDDIVALYRSMETPATDSFLAEVRASGVEMCSAEIQKQTWDEREGDGMVAAIDAMEIYAAQLRKGVQS